MPGPFQILFLRIGFLVCTLGTCWGIWAQKPGSPETPAVVLGLLIEDSLQVEARYGAQYAVNEINNQGSLHGRSIQLSVKSMEGPWGVGSKKAVDLVFDEKAWALIGVLSGRNSHLVEQVAAKTDIPFVSAWTADPTLSKAYVPQFFNCVPNSEQQAQVILKALNENQGVNNWFLVSDEQYDSEIAVESLKKTEHFQENPASEDFACNSSADFETLYQALNDSKPRALVVFCEPELSLKLIRFLRSRGVTQSVYTNMNLLHERTYSQLSRDQRGEVNVCASGNWIKDSDSDFVLNFKEEFGRNPGAMAVYAYDAVQILAEAILTSDFDPKKLKGNLSKTSYSGKTGTFGFDPYGNRKSITPLGHVSMRILSGSKP